MDFDSKEEINEEEIDALGMKKKDSDLLDVDVDEDATPDADVAVDEEKDPEEEHVFGVDKETIDYMFGDEE